MRRRVFAILGDRLFNNVVPVATLVFVVVAAVATFVLNFTRFGRYVFAVGGNERAARLSGVPVTLVKVSVYGITGLVSAIAGIVHAGQFNFGSANDGTGYELTAIAAVVIGGTSLFGGAGSDGRHGRGRGDAGRASQYPPAQQHQCGAAAARDRRDHRARRGSSISRPSPRGIGSLSKARRNQGRAGPVKSWRCGPPPDRQPRERVMFLAAVSRPSAFALGVGAFALLAGAAERRAPRQGIAGKTASSSSASRKPTTPSPIGSTSTTS